MHGDLTLLLTVELLEISPGGLKAVLPSFVGDLALVQGLCCAGAINRDRDVCDALVVAVVIAVAGLLEQFPGNYMASSSTFLWESAFCIQRCHTCK